MTSIPHRTRGLRTLWPAILIAVLSLMVLLVMGRPCEWYRMRVVFQQAEFGWTNTTCAPVADMCACFTSEAPTDYIFEGSGFSNDKPGARDHVTPEVVF